MYKRQFYDNLGHLQRLGLVASQAHMGDLRGEKVATGTLWAVSLQPGRVLGSHAAPVRLVHDDWHHEWRNLNRDVRAGRTVWNLLRPREQREPEGQEMPESYPDIETLNTWAITSASLPSSDTLTVRAAPGAVQDVVWNLGEGASVPRWERCLLYTSPSPRD